MRLHNLIVDYRETHEVVESAIDEIEKDLFNDDCRRYLATHSDMLGTGVEGGEDEICRDSNGDLLQGGRPILVESRTTAAGKLIRKKMENNIRFQNCERPRSNWFRESNRILME